MVICMIVFVFVRSCLLGLYFYYVHIPITKKTHTKPRLRSARPRNSSCSANIYWERFSGPRSLVCLDECLYMVVKIFIQYTGCKQVNYKDVSHKVMILSKWGQDKYKLHELYNTILENYGVSAMSSIRPVQRYFLDSRYLDVPLIQKVELLVLPSRLHSYSKSIKINYE